MPMSNRNKLPDTALMPNYAQCHVPGPLFLTPRGGKPLTCGLDFKPEYVPCISWRHLASALESSLQPHYKDFISANENSPSRQMAAHASFCFLNRVRTF